MEPARFRTSRRDVLWLGASAALASCLGPALARAGLAEAQVDAGTIPRVLSAEYRHGLDELTRGTASGLELRATAAGRPGLTSASSSGGSLVSRPVRFDFPVTHVGLHWVATGEPDRVALQVRTSVNGETWTPWQPVGVDVHGGPGPGGARCGTLASADRGRWVGYRVDLGGGAA
ncbi:MAG: hypothetical protein HY329_13165, partial [Chloroflexi bacterium]|nr:hypothetical protein [Chloroflexota bacterium]